MCKDMSGHFMTIATKSRGRDAEKLPYQANKISLVLPIIFMEVESVKWLTSCTQEMMVNWKMKNMFQ